MKHKWNILFGKQCAVNGGGAHGRSNAASINKYNFSTTLLVFKQLLADACRHPDWQEVGTDTLDSRST